MEFRGNTWTCAKCGGPMAGDFSSHAHPHAHCMNEHCGEFNKKKLLPNEPHKPEVRHHVKPLEHEVKK